MRVRVNVRTDIRADDPRGNCACVTACRNATRKPAYAAEECYPSRIAFGKRWGQSIAER